MEFYETEEGKRFFDVQVPSLIRALEDLTSVLKQKQAPVELPVETKQDFLRELYCGNIEIGVHSMENYSGEALKEVTALQDELKKQLTEEQWELFQSCSSKAASYASSEASRMFQHGFRLAVNLIVAGLGVSGENK